MRRPLLSLSIVSTLIGSVAAGPPAAVRDLPPVNAAVKAFCEEHAGEKVGDGQCSDLAYGALAAAEAKTAADFTPADGAPVWGEPVASLDQALPGDILHFREVKILVRSPSGVKAVRYFPDHVAIVARNRGGGRLDIYEQNVVTAGADTARREKMRKRETDFRGMFQGTLRIYRPVRKADSRVDGSPGYARPD